MPSAVRARPKAQAGISPRPGGALEHLAIARHEDADVRQGAQRARQRRRDLAETAGLHVVGDFRSNEKDLAARNRRLSLRGLALKVAKTL